MRPLDTPIFLLSSEAAPRRSRYWESLIGLRLAYLNTEFNGDGEKSLGSRNAFSGGGGYYRQMAPPRHDWFLKEWLKATEKKQADVVRDLDWNKAKVSLMIRGLQPYTREEINELADYLNIKPHELLMHPEDAMAIRRLRSEMIRLAHETEESEHETPVKKVS